jgi:hypothetical protein
MSDLNLDALLDSLADRVADRVHGDEGAAAVRPRLLAGGPGSVQGRVEDVRRFVTTRLMDLRRLLYTDVAQAKTELAKHVREIRLFPRETGGGRYYVAVGEWNLLGGYESHTGQPDPARRVRLVAGGGFEPPTFGL